MAIQVSGTEVISNARNISNVGTVTATSFIGSGASLTNLPAGGKVLQVVQAQSSTQYNYNGDYTWYQSANYTVSITPSSATSKILIMVQGGRVELSANIEVSTTIYRNNSVNLFGSLGGGGHRALGSGFAGPCSMVKLDSPSTTSATSYTLWNKGWPSSYYGIGSSTYMTLTAMEIAV